LFGGEELHVFEFKGVIGERKRLAIESMFEYENEPHGSLGESDNPLPGFRYTGTGVLTANEEEDGSCIGFEVVADDKVALLPVGSVLVVGVIEYLLEISLLLVEEVFGLGGLRQRPPFGRVFGESGDEENGE
jgi:hypothetical protein